MALHILLHCGVYIHLSCVLSLYIPEYVLHPYASLQGGKEKALCLWLAPDKDVSIYEGKGKNREKEEERDK